MGRFKPSKTEMPRALSETENVILPQHIRHRQNRLPVSFRIFSTTLRCIAISRNSLILMVKWCPHTVALRKKTIFPFSHIRHQFL